ncbi:MAG: Y-family DNA polymerase [Chlamydiales bacterium]|nr:Y-family DNA polymerase [Chlamydiales bacterium]
MSSIALVDGNDFFVSCERVFNPKLLKRPVAILSSNDGCIIARSPEVKALGIPMGAPLFEWREFCERHGVALLSSNFALYADLSRRMMTILEEESAHIEVYSIDEAFVEIEEPKRVRQKILQWTGIPVSIGVAKTKTLAKVANHIAKKRGSGICTDPFPYLEDFPVEEVWGIGRRLAQRLARHGVFTVGELLKMEERHFNVTVKRTVWELKGMPCLPICDESVSKQSIMTSRTFGTPITTEGELTEAIAAYAQRAAKKLREEKSLASWLQLFAHTKEVGTFSTAVTFSMPTDYTPDLIQYALGCLNFCPATYKKVGVLLGGLVPRDTIQYDLFCKPLAEKKKMAQATMDAVNAKFGFEVLSYAKTGTKRAWKMQRNFCSPRYTTQWKEILTISI